MPQQIGRALAYAGGAVAILVACVRAVAGDYDGAGTALAIGLTALGLDAVLTTLVTRLREVLPAFVDLDAILTRLLDHLAAQSAQDEARRIAWIRAEAEPGTAIEFIPAPVEGTIGIAHGVLTLTPAGAGTPILTLRLTHGITARVQDGDRVTPGRYVATYVQATGSP